VWGSVGGSEGGEEGGLLLAFPALRGRRQHAAVHPLLRLQDVEGGRKSRCRNRYLSRKRFLGFHQGGEAGRNGGATIVGK